MTACEIEIDCDEAINPDVVESDGEPCLFRLVFVGDGISGSIVGKCETHGGVVELLLSFSTRSGQ